MNVSEFATHNAVALSNVQDDGIIPVMGRLHSILTDSLSVVRSGRSASTVSVKAAVAIVEGDSTARTVTYDLGTAIREMVFSDLQNCPEASVLLLGEIANIVEEVRDVRALVMAGLDLPDSEEDSDDGAETTEEALEVANFAKDLLNNYSTLLSVLGHSLDDLPEEMRRTNKAGETAISLPKVPSAETSEKSGAGRPTAGGKFAFTLNGEAVPTSGFDRLAVFYCSTHTDRINGSDLKSTIKRQTGLEWSDKGNEQFTVEVPTGTLSATLESN